jgi:hypothetical protein
MAIKNTQIASATTTRLFLASAQQAITTMIFCNTDPVTDASFDVYVVPYGTNANPTTQIMKGVPLPAGETFVLDTERLILETNDAIYAQASENLIITATISSLTTA